MWRLTYLGLFVVRAYLALCPSYLHPDEIFQGPEPFAGHIFPYPSHPTWEWTTSRPIRSVFPLWPFYGLPMTLLKWLWAEEEDGLVDPAVIYYTLRLVMFVLSFVLEDWAIHELVRSPSHRRSALLLVTSSYVTWTFQTHTFSNSVETLLVLWSLILIERIVSEDKRSAITASVVLGFLIVFGTFNRVTFPAFIVIPGIQLLPHFLNRPFCLLALVASGLFWTLSAIIVDTAYHSSPAATRSFFALYEHLISKPVITPINNLLYNSQTENLAQHGLHPHYQHILVNLPQLLGPALVVLIVSAYPFNARVLKTMLGNPRLASAFTGTILLSLIPHQEPRFLLPTIPLLLTSIRLPTSRFWNRAFWISWALFNSILAVLMGIYHQGGVIPTQLAVPWLVVHSTEATNSTAHNVEVFWWKTYPPPNFLLGPTPPHPMTSQPLNISSVPLMGFPQKELVFMLMQHMPSCDPLLSDRMSMHQVETDIYVVAPLSAWRLEDPYPPVDDFSFYMEFNLPPAALTLTNLATYRQHLNLDDMDFGDDGVWNTLSRVVGRRGLGVWRVESLCPDMGPDLGHVEDGTNATSILSI
ncbi:hypothetical protein B0A52_06449 [Exophiala mesophila]|uniref:Mannosyltransferase n=1 Tax=Exophiala mesophila TaxID=212818 RepID=A0A438N2E0_EXOME|nr:hypothetical protein B0A52_06449 [Exophiala mesophila]